MTGASVLVDRRRVTAVSVEDNTFVRTLAVDVGQRDDAGNLTVWALRLDSSHAEVCQARIPSSDDPSDVGRVVEQVRSGLGDLPTSDADLELVLQALRFGAAGDWAPADVAAALAAAAHRLRDTAVAPALQDMARVATEVSPDRAAEMMAGLASDLYDASIGRRP